MGDMRGVFGCRLKKNGRRESPKQGKEEPHLAALAPDARTYEASNRSNKALLSRFSVI
jgi:hypothetical protein